MTSFKLSMERQKPEVAHEEIKFIIKALILSVPQEHQTYKYIVHNIKEKEGIRASLMITELCET